VRVDHGSHRLHRSCPAEILDELRVQLGDDLQLRHRHGRIRLAGRWVAFPPSIGDLTRRLPPSFTARLVRDAVSAPLREPEADTFADVVRAGHGPTMLDEFYAPYVEKIWGVPAEQLSGELARRRVGARTSGALLQRVLRPAERRARASFWYPRRGFGQIPEALAAAAAHAGAAIHCDTEVTGLALRDDGATVCASDRVLEVDQVWSTLPLPMVARLACAPADVLMAANGLRHRAMTLVYLAFDVASISEFDASYFPALDVSASRVSEPKRYRDGAATDPAGRTVLCAEIPCEPEGEVWHMTAEALGVRVRSELATQDLLLPEPSDVVVRRVRHAYPIYTIGFEESLATTESWALAQRSLLSLGRQGLFAHDNTHHALATAWAAAEALGADGRLDRREWAGARERFAAHVVED
jgi:protoporphyrinogen oxidase